MSRWNSVSSAGNSSSPSRAWYGGVTSTTVAPALTREFRADVMIASVAGPSTGSRHSPIRAPRSTPGRSSFAYAVGWESGYCEVAGSAGSRPWRTDRVRATSTTLRAIGPAVSCSAEIGTTPVRLTRPRLGLCPTVAVIPAGQTIEPSVSLPIATWASDAATPAADPPYDPHGLRASTYGLFVCPPTPDQPEVGFAARKFAHSDRFALPRITAPAARRRVISVASFAGKLRRARDPAVVHWSRVSTLSLTSTGMPSSGPRRWWVRRRASLSRAWPRAAGFSARTALTLPSIRWIRSR